MLEVIERSFRQNLTTAGWANKLREMSPSYGQSLIENPELVQRPRAETAAVLPINNINYKETENDSRVSLVHGA
jgi:malate dehydrogenase (quinone)